MTHHLVNDGSAMRAARLPPPASAAEMAVILERLPGLRAAWEGAHLAVRRHMLAAEHRVADVIEIAAGLDGAEDAETIEAVWREVKTPAEPIESGDDWRPGAKFKRGQRAWDLEDGQLYEAIVAHTSYDPAWRPSQTPSLWRLVQDEFAPWVQPLGAHDAYEIGDRVTYDGRRWESAVDANVHAPGIVPGAWIDLGSEDG